MVSTRNEIKEKLVDVIGMAMPNVDISYDNFDESLNLVSDLGLTSVGVLYVVIAIEEFFSIRFDDVGFADFKTMGDVVDYVERKLEK